MVSNKKDIITFLQTHKDEMAQRFGVVSVGLFGYAVSFYLRY